jgi:endonuclease/exonuclease/phosphatase (EEP) superfamily protein YafD
LDGSSNVKTLNPAPLVLLALVGLATGLALLAPLGWPFELFAHFRGQYAAAALVLVPLLVWRRRPVATALAIGLAAWNAAPGLHRAISAAPTGGCAGPSITVATVNLRYSNEDPGPFLDWLAATPVDLVVVQEVTTHWRQVLEQLGSHPHRYLLDREDPYGIGVLSRWPLESAGTIDLAGDGLPSVEGIVDAGGQRFRFLGLHTHWPVVPHLAESRDLALREAARLARDSDLPVVLLGDLNLTPDAPAFPRLIRESGLRDVMDGPRWSPTWRAGFWPLALRIDHILVSQGWCVEHAGVGPSIGSDHRPVTARLVLPR